MDGPLSLFQSGGRYGLSLALALPAIAACDRWRLDADVRWGADRRPLRFRLAGEIVAASQRRATRHRRRAPRRARDLRRRLRARDDRLEDRSRARDPRSSRGRPLRPRSLLRANRRRRARSFRAAWLLEPRGGLPPHRPGARRPAAQDPLRRQQEPARRRGAARRRAVGGALCLFPGAQRPHDPRSPGRAGWRRSDLASGPHSPTKSPFSPLPSAELSTSPGGTG